MWISRRFAAVSLALLAPAASAQVPAGPEFRVNSWTTGVQALPLVAVEPDGDFVIAWLSAGQDGSSYAAVARRYDVSGAPRGAEFLVNSYTTGGQGLPVPEVGRGGDLIAGFVDDRGVFVRRFDAGGLPRGEEFMVNTWTTGLQYRVDFARGAQSRFVVTWASEGVDGSGFGIAARAYDNVGPLGPEFVVNTYTTGPQSYAAVDVLASGDLIVVWEDRAPNRDGSGFAVFGQRLTAAGTPIGGEFRVNTYTTGNQHRPSVDASPAGGFLVAWMSPADGAVEGVSARRFDASGSPIGDEFVVNTATYGLQALLVDGVTHDERGNFVVVWQSATSRGFGQRFASDGTRRGGEFQINAFTTAPIQAASVRSDPVGNFVVAWGDYGPDGDRWGARARRFGGLVPAALRVDTAANGIVEPGETFDLRPTWRNVTGAPQAFTAQLATPPGPPGGGAAVLDGAATYGTVADGAFAECPDCYLLEVGDPAPRPAVHWDAMVVEKISPDAQGQEKAWAVHVGRSFTDVPAASPFYRFVETLLHHGVTAGCLTTTYCPASPTTREQMAVFVLIGKGALEDPPPPCGANPVFADVPASSPYCRWIEELARRGVVGGCGGGNYCPAGNVTREQMSVFVLRTLDGALSPPACVAGAEMFTDVPAASPFCRWIEELARRGVVTGCGGGSYCPVGNVTREQMGVFISVTFGLTLYGP